MTSVVNDWSSVNLFLSFTPVGYLSVTIALPKSPNPFHVKHEHDIARHNVSRETFVAIDKLMEDHQNFLEKYLDELLWWNKRINLVSRDVPRETVREHIRHSLLLHSFNVFRDAAFIVDAGTGGGFPGIPLAITHPSKTFLLNDIVTKKILAVRQMSQKLGLKNVSTADASVTELEIEKPFLLISKHAFKINDLFAMTGGMSWTEMVFYKGLDYEEELTGIDTPLAIEVFKIEQDIGDEFYRDKALVIVKRKNH